MIAGTGRWWTRSRSFEAVRHRHHWYHYSIDGPERRTVRGGWCHPVTRKFPARNLTPTNYSICYTRPFLTASVPPIFVPPAIFIGLLVALWTWKCFWIVVLQNKLLYLSWLPPFSRSDTIANYEKECQPVHWHERQFRSLDGTRLAVCEGRIPVDDHGHHTTSSPRRRRSVVICYFQGNGGSLPLRLPLLSQVLRSVATSSKSHLSSQETCFTIVALSYRGYWTSSGRATQTEIQLDGQAFLNWVSETYSSPDCELQIVLWGHSLGSAVICSNAVSFSPRSHIGRDRSSAIPHIRAGHGGTHVQYQRHADQFVSAKVATLPLSVAFLMEYLV